MIKITVKNSKSTINRPNKFEVTPCSNAAYFLLPHIKTVIYLSLINIVRKLVFALQRYFYLHFIFYLAFLHT